MDPDELEFIGEKTTIGIIPNFNSDPIHLISGTIGPFRAGKWLKIVALNSVQRFLGNFSIQIKFFENEDQQ